MGREVCRKRPRKRGSLPRVGVFRSWREEVWGGRRGGVLDSAHAPPPNPCLGLRPRQKLHRSWAGMGADGGVKPGLI